MKINLAVNVDKNEILKKIAKIDRMVSGLEHECWELRKIIGNAETEETTAKE